MRLLRARRSPASQAVQLPVLTGSYPPSQTQSVTFPDGDTRFGSLPHTPEAAAGVNCPKTSTSAATTATFVAAGILERLLLEAPLTLGLKEARVPDVAPTVGRVVASSRVRVREGRTMPLS